MLRGRSVVESRERTGTKTGEGVTKLPLLSYHLPSFYFLLLRPLLRVLVLHGVEVVPSGAQAWRGYEIIVCRQGPYTMFKLRCVHNLAFSGGSQWGHPHSLVARQAERNGCHVLFLFVAEFLFLHGDKLPALRSSGYAELSHRDPNTCSQTWALGPTPLECKLKRGRAKVETRGIVLTPASEPSPILRSRLLPTLPQD
ncbi:hypothetical protein GQ53DRAFT_371397 [Thozetella sp. PMI_491]|nr:hypothetical protein GQ53DRAFT_371397 [Thozetella sp. PMI_491]